MQAQPVNIEKSVVIAADFFVYVTARSFYGGCWLHYVDSRYDNDGDHCRYINRFQKNA